MNQEYQTFEKQSYQEIVKYWHEQIPLIINELAELFELPNNSWVKFNDGMDLFVVTFGLGQYYDPVRINNKIRVKFWNKYRIHDEFTNADIRTGYRYIFIRMKELEISQGRKWNYSLKPKDCMRMIKN